MVHRLNHQWLAQLGLESVLGCFSLRLSRIKRSQVMSIVKFSPTALNFGYDFALLVHFLRHQVKQGETSNTVTARPKAACPCVLFINFKKAEKWSIAMY